MPGKSALGTRLKDGERTVNGLFLGLSDLRATVLPFKSERIGKGKNNTSSCRFVLVVYCHSFLLPLKSGEFRDSCCFATADASLSCAKTVSNLYNVCLGENRLIDINVMQSHCQFAN